MRPAIKPGSAKQSRPVQQQQQPVVEPKPKAESSDSDGALKKALETVKSLQSEVASLKDDAIRERDKIAGELKELKSDAKKSGDGQPAQEEAASNQSASAKAKPEQTASKTSQQGQAASKVTSTTTPKQTQESAMPIFETERRKQFYSSLNEGERQKADATVQAVAKLLNDKKVSALRQEQIKKEVKAVVATAHEVGLTGDELVKLIRSIWAVNATKWATEKEQADERARAQAYNSLLV